MHPPSSYRRRAGELRLEPSLPPRQNEAFTRAGRAPSGARPTLCLASFRILYPRLHTMSLRLLSFYCTYVFFSGGAPPTPRIFLGQEVWRAGEREILGQDWGFLKGGRGHPTPEVTQCACMMPFPDSKFTLQLQKFSNIRSHPIPGPTTGQGLFFWFSPDI